MTHQTRGAMPGLSMLGLAMLALAACQSAPQAPQAAAPAPALEPAGSAIADQSFTPPDKAVPARYAAFSGIWSGRLAGPDETRLTVQTISSNGKVTATYAWAALGDNSPGEAAGAGRIAGTTLKLARLPNGADVSFAMQPDGTLAGTVELAGQTYTGTFVKL